MTVAFTGIRDLHPDSILRVRDAVFRVISEGAAAMRFGGALGADTVALLTAVFYAPDEGPRPSLDVIVPGRIDQQPAEAYLAIRRAIGAGATFTELGLDLADSGSFWARNRLLIRPAHAVMGFTDGRTRGGTAGTLKLAREAGKLVEEVRVRAA